MAKIETERDLAYWLMGYFEISRNAPNVTAEQSLTILKAIHGMKDDRKGELCKFITDALLSGGGDATHKIVRKLEDTFLHKIDPTIEGDQQQLQRTHRGGKDDKPLPPGVQAMC